MFDLFSDNSLANTLTAFWVSLLHVGHVSEQGIICDLPPFSLS